MNGPAYDSVHAEEVLLDVSMLRTCFAGGEFMQNDSWKLCINGRTALGENTSFSVELVNMYLF
jgi:hypothetical protein